VDGGEATDGFLVENIDTGFLKIVFEFAAVATLGNFIYVIGGYQRENWCSSDLVYRYDPSKCIWVELTKLQVLLDALCSIFLSPFFFIGHMFDYTFPYYTVFVFFFSTYLYNY